MALTILAPLVAIGGFAAYFVLSLQLALYRRVPWEFLAVVALGAALGLYALWRRPGLASGASALVSVAVLAVACWYLFSFSMFGPREDRPRVGEVFPDFTLTSSSGAPFHLAARDGRRHLLILYRGDWCPFCRTELGEIQKHYGAIAGRGVDVVAISVDPPEVSAKLRERLGSTIEFVSDPGGTLMDAIGVRDRDGLPSGMASGKPSRDIFLPTTFLLDEQRRVRWVYRPDTYRVRATPDQILAEIDALETALPGGTKG